MSWRPQPRKKSQGAPSNAPCDQKKPADVISIVEHKNKVEQLKKSILKKLQDDAQSSTKAAIILAEWLKKK